MILVLGYGTDAAVRLVLDAADELGVQRVLVDQQADPLPQVLLAGGTGVLEVGGTRTRLDEIDGVYARPLSPTGEARRAEQGRALTQLLVDWLEGAPCRVASRPSAMHSNSSKPFQAQLIAAAGLAVPTTLVTDDPDEVRAFVAEQGDVVYKSVSGIRSIVRRLDGPALARLDRVRSLPTQFQACVPGTDVRVHVVGQQVFATAVECDAVDYRYAGRDGLPFTLVPTALPDEVAQRCVDLAGTLGLPLAGIDLRRTPTGEWVCFEVNPMPGYSFYESNTGQPISRALVRYLAGKAD